MPGPSLDEMLQRGCYRCVRMCVRASVEAILRLCQDGLCVCVCVLRAPSPLGPQLCQDGLWLGQRLGGERGDAEDAELCSQCSRFLLGVWLLFDDTG